MMDAWITQLRKGLVEYCLLMLLSQGESHGYELVQTLRDIDVLAVSESTVYPVLSRLRADGLLRVRETRSASGPPRRSFSLTALGRVRLAAMRTYLGEISAALDLLNRKTKE